MDLMLPLLLSMALLWLGDSWWQERRRRRALEEEVRSLRLALWRARIGSELEADS